MLGHGLRRWNKFRKLTNLVAMKITVNRLEAPYYLEARNEEGNAFTMDASPDIGGTGRGFRPMQTLLGALGGCSSIDVVTILERSKQRLDDIQVTLEGHRQAGVGDGRPAGLFGEIGFAQLHQRRL